MTPAELDALCVVMRRHGVSSVTDGTVSVNLWSAPQAPIKPSDFESAALSTCQCGHSPAQHGDHGLCLVGCDVDKCEGAESAKQ